MQLSHKDKSHNKIDYFTLPNGYADVYLHRNERIEIDEEGNEQYIAEEVYFQVDQSVTKEQIEENFEFMWNDAEKVVEEPTQEDRLTELENTILFLLTNGGM